MNSVSKMRGLALKGNSFPVIKKAIDQAYETRCVTGQWLLKINMPSGTWL